MEADKNRRMLKDVQWAKRHKDLQELHEYKEKMRKGQMTPQKQTSCGVLRATSHAPSHMQGSLTSTVAQTCSQQGEELLKNIGLSSTQNVKE